MSLPKAAVLIVSRSHSSCSNCLGYADPEQSAHIDLMGYSGRKGGGCGAEWVAKTTDNLGSGPEEIAHFLPELPFVPYIVVRIGAKL